MQLLLGEAEEVADLLVSIVVLNRFRAPIVEFKASIGDQLFVEDQDLFLQFTDQVRDAFELLRDRNC